MLKKTEKGKTVVRIIIIHNNRERQKIAKKQETKQKKYNTTERDTTRKLIQNKERGRERLKNKKIKREK